MPSALYRPYCTLEDVQRETQNVDTGEVLDKFIDCINGASRFTDEYCRRDFWFHDHSQTPILVPVIGHSAFMHWPILELSGIQLGTEDTILTEGYTFNASVIDLTDARNRFGKLKGLVRSVKVYGKFGYQLVEADLTATPPIIPEEHPPVNLPYSIRKATALIASAWSGEYTKDRIGIDGQRVSVSETRIPLEATKLLSMYRAITV